MDALYPRLLVRDFPAMFRFYDGVLPTLIEAHRIKGEESGPYANWDVDDEAVLVLYDHAMMAKVTGEGLGQRTAHDTVAFVSRVTDVDAGFELCLKLGATPVAPPTDRPEWGPKMRTAHLRDPEGNLLEIQSY